MTCMQLQRPPAWKSVKSYSAVFTQPKKKKKEEKYTEKRRKTWKRLTATAESLRGPPVFTSGFPPRTAADSANHFTAAAAVLMIYSRAVCETLGQ